MRRGGEELSLEGKVALITGAGTGIGKGISKVLAERGVRIGINYNSSEDGARDTLEQVRALGSDGILLKANVADKAQVETMMKTLAEQFGGIDILVNNSAAQKNLGLMDYDEAGYDLVMSVNLMGYFLCSQASLPYLKEAKGGRIINVSSVHGKRPTDFDVVYAMTKGGIKMLTRECAIEFAKYGITVNTIEPGAVQIGTKSGKPRPIVPADKVVDEHRRRGGRKFPLGRSGIPSDIGYLVAYLASEESEFISGAAIRADGVSMLM